MIKIKNPRVLIVYAIIFFIPYTAFRIIGLKISEILTIVLILTLPLKKIKIDKVITKYTVSISVIIIISAVISMFDPIRQYSQGINQGIYYSFEFGWIFRLIRLWILWYFSTILISIFKRDGKCLFNALNIYVLSNVIIDLYGVYLNRGLWGIQFGINRYHLMCVEASEAGFVNCFAIIIAVFLYLNRRKKIYLFELLILCVGQLLIGSTGSIVSVFISLLVTYIFVYGADKKINVKKMIYTIIFIAIFVFIFYFILTKTAILDKIINYRMYINQRNSSLAERITAIVSAIKMFEERPIFGIGIGNYGWYIAHYRTSINLAITPGGAFQPNNLYAQLMSELGIFGIGIYISFILENFKTVFNLRNRTNKYLEYLFLNMLVYLVIHNLTLTTFFSFQFWLCISGIRFLYSQRKMALQR